MKNYFTIKKPVENLIVIERSKFICYLSHCGNEEDAKNFISAIKKQNSLANHNCYAYIADEVGLVQKFSDDGEPQGTAGLPMLDVLKVKKLYKTVVVVTRYFGGIKLGTGGLTRAYSGSVVSALEKAEIVNMQEGITLSTILDYDKYSIFNKFIQDFSIANLKTEYGNNIEISFSVKLTEKEKFIKQATDVFLGKIAFTEEKVDFYPFKN
ncbi:MAG: YigZ family protein [Clostridia bacterium]|nr:YigZ family protein [Clostridia bacterium]